MCEGMCVGVCGGMCVGVCGCEGMCVGVCVCVTSVQGSLLSWERVASAMPISLSSE